MNPLLLSTVEVLKGLRSESGCNISRFLSQVPSQPSLDSSGLCTFDFQGHTIRDGAQQRSEAAPVYSQFVSIVIENLKARFTEEGDAAILGALTKLFDPSLYGFQSVSPVLSEASDVDYLSSCGLGSEFDLNQELSSFFSYAGVQVAAIM